MEGDEIYRARFGGESFAGKAPPGDIQWMPPGQHAVTVTRVSDGEPVDLTLTVDADTAAVAQAELERHQVSGKKPYFDFDHQDHEASGRPTRFFWAGDDIVKGGVRCDVDWSKPGGEAVVGKSYDRFSPNFIPRGGKVIGAPVNMGGLVNAPAFEQISPLMAKHTNKSTVMTEKEIADLQAENARLKRETETLQAKAASATTSNEALRLQTENERLKADNEALQAKHARSHAEHVVEAAVRAGKIPAKNEGLKAKWVDTIAANPDSAALLNDMPGSALLTTLTPAAGADVQARGAGAADHEFMVQAKRHAKENSMNLADALTHLGRERNDLYEDYRRSMGLGPKTDRD